MEAYLTHPSIKVQAKAGKQVHDSFSKLITLTYLLVLSSSSGALPWHPILHISSNGRSGNEAPHGSVTGGCPCLSPHWCDAAMGRGGQLDDATIGELIPASNYLLRWRWGADDFLELVEQLDMATSTLYEESRVADRLRLCCHHEAGNDRDRACHYCGLGVPR
jgi:hypothetical protein